MNIGNMEDNYNEKHRLNEEEFKKKFEYYLKDFPLTEEDLQKPFLDVGTGEGKFIGYLREFLGNRKAFGVEKQSHKILGKEGFVAANGLKLPFENEKFEIVTAHNYLPMFVSNPTKTEEAIRELLRVAKQGGKVMFDITTPELEKRSDEKVKDILGAEYTEKSRLRHSERYTGTEQLQRFLEDLKKEFNVEVLTPAPNKVVVVIKK